jgi:hypothetical protein
MKARAKDLRQLAIQLLRRADDDDATPKTKGLIVTAEQLLVTAEDLEELGLPAGRSGEN